MNSEQDRKLLRGMRNAMAEAATPGVRTVERSLMRALAQIESERNTDAVPVVPTRRGRGRWSYGLMAASAMAAGIAVYLQMSASNQSVIRDAVLVGQVSAGATLNVGDPLPIDQPLNATPGVVLAVGHARVSVEANARLRWKQHQSTVEMDYGALSVAVDPGPHRRFLVVTPRFRVEVLGTRYRVDLGTVSVSEGRVRVLDLKGNVLVASLTSGQHWTFTEPNVASAPVTPSPTEPSNNKATAAITNLDREPQSVRINNSTKTSVSPAADIVAACAEIRGLLAHGQTNEAESRLNALLEEARRPVDRAEGESLRAELALVRGDRSSAVRLYRVVAERYRNLRAGEVAMFAAGRAALEGGASDEGAQLLREYLERYPNGLFRKEAAERLSRVSR